MPFVDEIAARLVAQSVGVLGSTILLGTGASLPKADPLETRAFLSIVETGGSAPTRVQNASTAHTQRPTAQIAVRANSYAVARTMARAAYVALDGVFNTTLSGTFYQRIIARQEPTDIGLDDAGRKVIVFNIEAEKAFS